MSTLSRTAADIFWMARYLERAEIVARLVEMGARASMLPSEPQAKAGEWRSVIAASGAKEHFKDLEIDERTAILGLMVDRSNPTSVVSCVDRARQNARAVRTALTTQSWETLNEAWLRLGDMTEERALRELAPTIDWVKGLAAQFRGAVEATMLREDRYDFMHLGTHIERADMTLRLLEVKHAVLLPETDVIGGGRNRAQWTDVLVATAALRAYHWVYRGAYSPTRIVDFLVLNRASPRSVAHCYGEIFTRLETLEARYGARELCHETARETRDLLNATTVDEVFQDGLREFLQTLTNRNNALSREIAEAYYF